MRQRASKGAVPRTDNTCGCGETRPAAAMTDDQHADTNVTERQNGAPPQPDRAVSSVTRSHHAPAGDTTTEASCGCCAAESPSSHRSSDTSATKGDQCSHSAPAAGTEASSSCCASASSSSHRSSDTSAKKDDQHSHNASAADDDAEASCSCCAAEPTSSHRSSDTSATKGDQCSHSAPAAGTEASSSCCAAEPPSSHRSSDTSAKKDDQHSHNASAVDDDAEASCGCCAAEPPSSHRSSDTSATKGDQCSHSAPAAGTEASCGFCAVAASSSRLASDAPLTAGDQRTVIRIRQMDCPVEENLIRKKLAAMQAVNALEFNLMQRQLTVTHRADSLDAILAAIRALGFEAEVAAHQPSAPAEPSKISWRPLVVAGVAALAAEGVSWSGLPEWLGAVLALLAVVVCGLDTYKKGWIALRNGELNINALMSIAVTGALILRQWPEAAMVMTLFTLAERIEARSLDRARNAIRSLLDLTPDTATVRQPDGSWQVMEARVVQPGSIVTVKPGERIALDGVIVKGQTTVDQAPITGESLPVDKTTGDKVFAGTINQTGTVEYQVSVAASDTTLARIIHAVEEAQGVKAPTQRFVDRFAKIYTPAVLVLAVIIAVLPPLAGLGSWKEWVYNALVMLVIACPCALVISTPVTVVSGLTAAARQGILVKGGVYLEQGRKLATLVLDKTGTITWGRPVQTDVRVFGDGNETDIRTAAASLASYSDHPVSQAVARAAADLPKQEVEAFTAIPGYGIRGTIDGQPYALGNLRFTETEVACPPAITALAQTLESQGKTVVLLNDGRQALALFAVADSLKTGSREAIEQLHTLNVKTVMLSGDNPHTVQAIAAQVGIDEARGDQLPEDKRRTVETYARSGLTGMIGDGINDAPALAAADIGFAMGAMGTDAAIETADVALMDDDLRKIPAFIALSQRTYRVLIQNISLALGIKALFMILTLLGVGTLWMAVFADMGASLLVIANGLRLTRK